MSSFTWLPLPGFLYLASFTWMTSSTVNRATALHLPRVTFDEFSDCALHQKILKGELPENDTITVSRGCAACADAASATVLWYVCMMRSQEHSAIRTSCVVALLIAASFFSRHIAGIVYTHGRYSCLVYNPASVRQTPPAPYDFLPDDISWDESRAYARWTNEILRGEWGGATLESFAPFLTSAVPRPPLWLRDRLGPALLAAIARLPGSSVPAAFLLADFLFPAAAAFALLLLCWEIRPSLEFAVSATCVVMFFNWQDSLNFVAFLRGAPQNESIFLRTPYPQLSTVFFCLFLWALLRLVRRPNLARSLIFSGILLVNFLTYFYSWTYALTWAGAVFVLLLASCLWPELLPETPSPARALWALPAATALASAAAFPIWIGIVRKNAASQDAFLRLGGVLGHRPELKYSLTLALCCLALLFFRAPAWKTRWIALAFLLASIAVMNLQVLAGRTIQPGHWAEYYIQPLFLLFAADLLWNTALWRKKQPWHRVAALALLSAGVVCSLWKFSAGARQSVNFNRRDANFDQVVALLHRPDLRSFGFLSNDVYLSTVLPAFVVEKPLLPWYMDPETDRELAALQRAAARVLDPKTSRPQEAELRLALREDKVLLVLDRHRPFSSSLRSDRQLLLENDDFLVLAPADAPR